MKVLSYIISALFFSNISYAENTPSCDNITISDTANKLKATYDIKNANDKKTRKVGLMNIKNMPENEGMLFSWNNLDKRYMWMKDTYISLDMIFIRDNTIIGILKNAKPLSEDILTIHAKINKILELNAGQTEKYDFKAGDIIKCIN